MNGCRRGTYLTPSQAFVKMTLSAAWLSSLLWIQDLDLLCVTDHIGHIKIIEAREPPVREASAPKDVAVRRPLSLLIHTQGQARLNVLTDVTKLHSLAIKAMCWCEVRLV
jgi:hypothetical protein